MDQARESTGQSPARAEWRGQSEAPEAERTWLAPSSPLDRISHLHRSLGNHALGRLSRAGTLLQPKLAIGKVDDPLEQEADRVADQVMRMPAPGSCSECEEDETTVRRCPAPAGITPVAIQRAPSAPVIRRQWSDATTDPAISAVATPSSLPWNKAEASVAGVRRIPLENIAGGNAAKDPQAATKEGADNRAIALIPPSLDASQPVDVLLHLHGHNVGYRQRATKGPDDETLGVGTVRDVESDRIEQQIAASKRPIIGVLPQGTAGSEFGKLDSDAYIKEVFKALTAKGAWGPGVPAPSVGRVILSGHSGAGAPIADMLAEPGTPRLPAKLAEVALFDSINGPNELRMVTAWVLQHLDADLAALTALGAASGVVTPAQAAYLQKSIRFRAYYTNSSYRERHEKLQKSIDDWFKKNAATALGAGSPLYTQLYDNYRTLPVHHGAHNKIMGKDDKLLDALTALPAASPPAGSVQPKSELGASPPTAAPLSVVETLHTSGTPVDPATREFMETRFGYDFSSVRIHADAEAARSASAIHAQAYTLGNHVVFTSGAYAPRSDAGARLLAHELTHVVQQGAAAAAPSGIVQRQAVRETAPPIRADEAGNLPPIFNFGQFSIFVPDPVWFASRKEFTNIKVHVFFAAGGVQGSDTNDIFVHGLRGASKQSEWITIGVPGILNSANSISDSEIQQCLNAVGIHSPPIALRLTGHSRGCDSVLKTVAKGAINKQIIDRITLLDEAVEHDRSGAVRFNRVQQLVGLGISSGIITAYESAHKSRDLVTGQSAMVRGATYHDLNPECMAAIGAARLVQDAIALRPDIAQAAAAIPAIGTQLRDINLPPRGSFTTGPTAGTQVNINEFCLEPADPNARPGAPRKLKASIKAIRRDPVLVRFINQKDLARYSTVSDWTPFLAHEFFVAELAHELTS